MVTNELVNGRGVETVEGFEVFPLPDEAVETVAVIPPVTVEVKPKRKRKAKVVKAAPKVVKGKRGPGRPRVYNGTQRRIVAAALKKHGLTKGIEWLATERKLKVSLTLARDVAEEFEIGFKRGRPAA